MAAARPSPFDDSEVRRIHRFPIFASMSRSELVNVLSKGERTRYRKGETASRTMKVLEESGFFEGKGKRLRIPLESLVGSA